MEYMVFLSATLVLAVSFPNWEPAGRIQSAAGKNRVLGLAGVVGHLGGTIAIAWLSGFAAGALALFAIPFTASMIYTLIVNPLAKSIRRKSSAHSSRHGARQIIRQY